MDAEQDARRAGRGTGVSDDAVSRAVEAVIGVSRASVRLPRDGERGNLRIVFDAGADRREVAARVASVLSARFRLRIDAEAIARLAEEEEEEAEEPSASAPPVPSAETEPVPSVETEQAPQTRTRGDRPTIRGLEIDGSGLEVEVRVTLGLHDQTVTGTATAAATTRARLRAVGAATLDAAGLLLAEIARLELDELDVIEDDDHARVVATVSLLTYEAVERLVGAALVRDGDVERAVVRAALDAVNRRVQILLLGS